ncbi:MAG: 50S ribosomal protein L24e [Zestosphaera sp.]
MVRVDKCSFCGGDVPPGSGLTLVKNDGTLLHFCSSKCFKNYKLRRDPKRTPWTKYYLGGRGRRSS